MTVLVLGASSHIGSAIAEAFSKSNDLIFTGRNGAALDGVASRCRAKGASSVTRICSDLSSGLDGLTLGLSDKKVDVVINASSATSQLTDSEIDLAALQDYLSVDVIAPVELIRLLAITRHPLRVIYISTILAILTSPNRVIYGSLKAVQEKCLRVLQSKASNMQLMVVRVAKPIPPHERTPTADRLAASVYKAFTEGRADLTFGTAGRALHALFYIQPLLFELVMSVYRSVSRRQGDVDSPLARAFVGRRK